ncbi:MAG: tetratricopeptide repeat protein [Cytophagales bacterium]|nr:tetratricopeptide repeat protein [Cytophagales bacterium]
MSKSSKPVFINTPQPFTDKFRQAEGYVKKNQKWLYTIGALIIAVIVGLLLRNHYQSRQEVAAQGEMFQAVYYFEKDSLDEALQGDGVYLGFLDIIDEYSATLAANLAHFYTGVIYMHQNEYEEAISHLEKFKASDFLLQARAWSLIGDAFTEQGTYAKAAHYYKKAANYKPNKFFTPLYLMKAALAYEENSNHQSALQCYNKIIEEFPDTGYYGEARKHKSRLEALAQ